MGLFGFGKKKKAAAEAAKAAAAKKEKDLLDSIKYWDYDRCRKELEAYENGDRDHYSYRVVEAINNRKFKLGRESVNRMERRNIDAKIAEAQARVNRLQEKYNNHGWSGAGSDGYYFATTSTSKIAEIKRELDSAKRELENLRRQRDSIGRD